MYPLDSHTRIALQFSGGKDSLAALYLLRTHWERITVYWLNTGNAFPETHALMAQTRDAVPNFVEVQGDQEASFSQHGYPSDLVPAEHTPIGVACGGSPGPLIQGRYDCCWRVLMKPLHDRMVEDRITLIIRGEKSADAHRAQHGSFFDGISYYSPIENWTDTMVLRYLRSQHIALPRFYEEGHNTSFDCMDCTAWWGEGRAAYLKRHHPAHYERLMSRLNEIEHAILWHARPLQKELE